jgi:hypothetical protein
MTPPDVARPARLKRALTSAVLLREGDLPLRNEEFALVDRETHLEEAVNRIRFRRQPPIDLIIPPGPPARTQRRMRELMLLGVLVVEFLLYQFVL